MAFEITVGRDEKAQKELGDKGRVLIGKAYVKMGRTTSLSNPIYMDVARAHVVYIVGKRGSGKCMAPETKIQIADNSWLTIEDIYKKYSKSSETILQNEKELLLKINQELIIKSMAPNLTLINMPVSHIYRKKLKEDLYIIKVEDREITVTPEHPLFVFKDNAFSWIPASQLTENDKIAIPLKNQSLISLQNSGKELIKEEQIIFSTITKIKKLFYEGYVYDLTVPLTHNFVAGTNEGIICHNSYSMGAIAEGIMDLEEEVRNNLSMIMFDTMGVYWTMKYPNEKDADLLDAWGLEGKGMPVKIYTPHGFFDKYKEDGVPTDSPFAIKASDLGPQDWILSFQLAQNHPTTIIIEKVLGDLIDEKIVDYTISDIIKRIDKDKDFEEHEKNDAINRFRNAERWGLFSETGTNMMDLVQPGQVTVLDLSPYVATPGGWGVKALVIGLIGMRVFSQRMLARKTEEVEAINVGYSYFQTEQEMGKKGQLPIVWFVIDEAHEFVPKVGKTAATDALVTIMREGRQPGVCLMMATQQPGKIHSDVMSQSDIILAHRLTAKPDVQALASMSQSYLAKGLPLMLDNLPRQKGAGILLDDNSERFYPMRVRPRLTWHGGEAPSAIKYKRKLDLGLD